MRVLLWMRIFLLVMIMAKFVFPHGYLIIITLFCHFSVSIRTLLYYNPKQTQLKLWTNLTFIKICITYPIYCFQNSSRQIIFTVLNIQHDVDFTLPLCSCWGFRRCRCCFFVVEKLVLHWPLGILSAFFLLMFHFTFSSSAQICFIVTIRRVKSIFAVRVHTKKKKLGSHLLCKRQNFSFYQLTISLTFWCK